MAVQIEEYSLQEKFQQTIFFLFLKFRSMDIFLNSATSFAVEEFFPILGIVISVTFVVTTNFSRSILRFSSGCQPISSISFSSNIIIIKSLETQLNKKKKMDLCLLVLKSMSVETAVKKKKRIH